MGGQAVVSALFQLDFIPVFPLHHWEHLIVNIIEADVLWNVFLPLKMSCSSVSDAWTVGRGTQYPLQAAQIHTWGTLLSHWPSVRQTTMTKIRTKYNWEDVSSLWIGCFYSIQLCCVTNHLKTIWSSPCVHTKTSPAKHQWITLWKAGILSIATVLALAAYVGFKASFVRRLAGC